MKIVVIDYGIGNVQSIVNVLNQFKDIEIILSDKKSDILGADGIILPGVGAYRKAMEELIRRELPDTLKKCILLKKPFLGICLGMQLLFDSSEEFGITNGLGFIKGKVKYFPNTIDDKLPHISWNSIYRSSINWDKSIFKDIDSGDDFYFVHSCICKPENKNIILSETEYGGIEFCSAIQKDNIYGCQFHPEKSARNGIKVMSNFVEAVENQA